MRKGPVNNHRAFFAMGFKFIAAARKANQRQDKLSWHAPAYAFNESISQISKLWQLLS
jgi:hypothetical protein